MPDATDTPPDPSWHRQVIYAFDVETTGVDPEVDRIVTASVARVGGGEPPEFFSWLIDPGIAIPEGATAIHGITNDAASQGEDPAVAIHAIVEVLAQRPPGSALVAFNASFDLTMLDREAQRYGLLSEQRPLVVDPHVIDRWLDRYRTGSRTLTAVCKHYGVPLDGAHDAGNDAMAAARLAWVLAERGRVVRRPSEAGPLMHRWAAIRHDLPALHEAQRGWAAFQSITLAEHFHDTGHSDKAADVRLGWPIVPRDADVLAVA